MKNLKSDFFYEYNSYAKMTGNECLRCNSTVRPRQEAKQCDNCLRWQHRVCGTGKLKTKKGHGFLFRKSELG
jgi:hypothetical protein